MSKIKIPLRVIEVIDGRIGNADELWWWCMTGPEKIEVCEEESKNIRQYPKIYSINPPKYFFTDGEVDGKSDAQVVYGLGDTWYAFNEAQQSYEKAKIDECSE